MRLTGRVALITGAAGGIGQAVAQRFAAEGASLWLADVADCAPLAAELGARALRLDVTREADWAAAARAVGPLHALVNNTGISGLRAVDDMALEEWRRFQAVNLEGAMLGMRAMLPALRRAAAPAGACAAVVNVGSTLALRPQAMLPAYAASKAGLAALTKAVALDCARRGERVRVNALHPGSVETAMMRANAAGDPQALARRMAAHPLAAAWGHLVTADDVAAAALFLCCDDSRMVTGIDLVVDAGATI